MSGFNEMKNLMFLFFFPLSCCFRIDCSRRDWRITSFSSGCFGTQPVSDFSSLNPHKATRNWVVFLSTWVEESVWGIKLTIKSLHSLRDESHTASCCDAYSPRAFTSRGLFLLWPIFYSRLLMVFDGLLLFMKKGLRRVCTSIEVIGSLQRISTMT